MSAAPKIRALQTEPELLLSAAVGARRVFSNINVDRAKNGGDGITERSGSALDLTNPFPLSKRDNGRTNVLQHWVEVALGIGGVLSTTQQHHGKSPLLVIVLTESKGTFWLIL